MSVLDSPLPSRWPASAPARSTPSSGSGHPDHLPDAALLRLPPARRERLEQHRPRCRWRDRGCGLPPRARRPGARPCAVSCRMSFARLGRRRVAAAGPAAGGVHRPSCRPSSRIALVLVVFGPRLQAAASVHRHGAGACRWHAAGDGGRRPPRRRLRRLLRRGAGRAAHGLLSALSLEPLQRLNGYKNVLGSSSTPSPR